MLVNNFLVGLTVLIALICCFQAGRFFECRLWKPVCAFLAIALFSVVACIYYITAMFTIANDTTFINQCFLQFY